MTTPCPCGSDQDYTVCCGPYLRGTASPTTPEALMRSRYSAYTLADIDYIAKTMCGKASMGFNPVAAQAWATSVKWLGLTVTKAYQTQKNVGFVDFVATYSERNQVKYLHECSRFERIGGVWFYIEALSR